jgi:uncharacterized Zn-binding protein involved in type VI secretion
MPGVLRESDLHVCEQFEGSVPHVGGPAGAPQRPFVRSIRVNGLRVITKGDAVVCIGRPDKVVGGINSVRFAGRPAGDSSALTDHQGAFVTCSTDVHIG